MAFPRRAHPKVSVTTVFNQNLIDVNYKTMLLQFTNVPKHFVVEQPQSTTSLETTVYIVTVNHIAGFVYFQTFAQNIILGWT